MMVCAEAIIMCSFSTENMYDGVCRSNNYVFIQYRDCV